MVDIFHKAVSITSKLMCEFTPYRHSVLSFVFAVRFVDIPSCTSS